MDATTVAVDLAKDVFEVALANRAHAMQRLQRLLLEGLHRDRLNPATPVGFQ